MKCLNLPNFHYSKPYSNIPTSNSYKCSQIRDTSSPHFDYIRKSNMISNFYVFQFKVSDELGCKSRHCLNRRFIMLMKNDVIKNRLILVRYSRWERNGVIIGVIIAFPICLHFCRLYVWYLVCLLGHINLLPLIFFASTLYTQGNLLCKRVVSKHKIMLSTLLNIPIAFLQIEFLPPLSLFKQINKSL